MNIRIAIIILFLTFGQMIFAQNPFIKNYRVSEGLPTNNVRSVLLDSKGFIWFGTNAGLTRYDGNNFVNYSTADGLTENNVLKIKESKDGTIWIMNFNGTINFYRNNQFHNENNTPFLAELRTNFRVRDFYEDEDSTIYFYSSKSEVFVVKNYELVDYRYFGFNNPEDQALHCLTKTRNENLILWTSKGYFELENLDDSLKLTNQDNRSHNTFSTRNNEIVRLDEFGYLNFYWDTKFIKRMIKVESQVINSMVRDPDGLLWLSKADKGIYCYQNDSLLLHLQISAPVGLMSDHENNIWVTTTNDGVYKISRDIFKYKLFDLSNFKGKGILKLAKANNGGIWATNGSTFYSIKNNRIGKNLLNLENRNVDQMYQLKDNTLLFKGLSPALYLVKHVDYNKSWIPNSFVLLRTHYGIKQITVDNNEQFLYSSLDDRLITVDLSDFSCSVASFRRGRINNTFVSGANELIVNAPKNYIVVNKQRFNENYLTPLNGRVFEGHVVLDKQTQVINAEGTDLFLIENEKIYNLISLDDLKYKNKIKKYMAFFENTLFFHSFNTVFYINNPKSVVDDINPDINRINIEFNNINDIICNNGFLYVASDDGLLSISIDEMENAEIVTPKPYVYAVSLDEQDYDFSAKTVIYKKHNRLRIDFASQNYSSIPSTYSYILEGADNTWNEGSETRVVYSNLSPGKYIFKLKARKNQEDYSGTVELPIIVKPTFFQILLVQVFAVLLFLFLVFIIVRYFYLQQIKERETETLLVTLEHKALLSMMNPHFIFNSLGSIQKYLLTNNPKEAGSYLSRFARLIRQNMNSLKTSFICIDDEVDRLRNYIELEKFRMNNKFDYNLEVDNTIDGYDVEIPSMIIQPFVENAIWHGISTIERQGQINVRFVARNQKSIFVFIEDNGIGISKAKPHSKSDNNLNMGVSLTRKRLKLIGDKFNVKVKLNTSELYPGNAEPGTVVKMIVPIVSQT